jgi:hypothetical protein
MKTNPCLLYWAIFNTSRRLYVPQTLHTLWVCTSSPHLVQGARLGIAIFHVCARRLSRLAFDILPFGQMAPMSFTSHVTPVRYT